MEGCRCIDDKCYPTYATFADWNRTFGTYVLMPDKDYEIMSYEEYRKIIREVEDYVKSIPPSNCNMEQQCPEWHTMGEGQCVPMVKTFKEWVEITGIGDMIPSTWEKITYDEFRKSVNEVLADVKLLRDIRETYCEAESLIDRGRVYQEEFNRKMAKYNGG